MKKLPLMTITFLLSQFGVSSISHAFDVTGWILFYANESHVQIVTSARAADTEDVDIFAVVAKLKVVLASSETELGAAGKTCFVPNVVRQFWFCSASVFDQPASVGCKYCNRGVGHAFDVPSGKLIGTKTLVNSCKINTNPGGGRWREP